MADQRPQESSATKRPRTDPVATRLQERIDQLVARKRIPHVVLGVARGDGSFAWHGAAGRAYPDGTAMQPDTPYFIASVTKLYIATIILQLYERGHLDLDRPFAVYLPPEQTVGLHRLHGVDHTVGITVRHLLSHTSGLPDFLEDHAKRQPSIYEQLARNIDRSWTLDDALRITRELGPHFMPQPRRAKRQKARYSDTNFQLLIAVIEEVTGLPFHKVLEHRLFRPLELTHTWLPGHSEPLEPVAEPAMLWSQGKALEIPGAMSSSYDLMSTTDDTIRFMQALTRGEVFNRPSTYRLMQARWNRVFYPIDYGLGMMRFKINRLFAPGWRPVALLGHSGATGSWLFHCPELDLYVTGTVDEISAHSIPFRFLVGVLRTVGR